MIHQFHISFIKFQTFFKLHFLCRWSISNLEILKIYGQTTHVVSEGIDAGYFWSYQSPLVSYSDFSIFRIFATKPFQRQRQKVSICDPPNSLTPTPLLEWCQIDINNSQKKKTLFFVLPFWHHWDLWIMKL